jgi:hypothetical protein
LNFFQDLLNPPLALKAQKAPEKAPETARGMLTEKEERELDELMAEE